MKKSIVYILGLLTGLVISAVCWFVFYHEDSKPYVVLNTDCNIEGAGVLQKGTILKIDEGMSEGFTRYILYLNIKGNHYTSLHKTPYENAIIPYWLNPIETANQ